MNFRLARHTSDLDKIIQFYHNILELEILGKFQNHNKYDGVFLGFSDSDWHLEFTVSDENPIHQPDEDDLLVFYFEDEMKLNYTKSNLIRNNYQQLEAKNSYWNENGFLFSDPDGFGIILTIKK